MDNIVTYHKMENEIYFIDGILSFLKATRRKLFFAILLYLMMFVFEYILRKPIEFTNDSEKLNEQYDELIKIYAKFNKVIPEISASRNLLFPERFKKRFYHYDAFLEDLIDGLAIAADRQAKEDLERLPAILEKVSDKLPTLDDVLENL